MLASVTAALAMPGGAFATPIWVGSWSTSPVEPGLLAGAVPFYGGTGGRTVRDMVHLTLGGPSVRVRVSNVFGSRTASFSDVRIAIAAQGAAIRPGTGRRLHFSGRAMARIAPGHQLTSDPVRLRVRSGETLAISIYAPGATGVATVGGSLNHTNYVSGAGDAAGSISPAAFATTSTSWYWIGGVDVTARSSEAGAIVALGDSITAGYASTLDANRDWVDLLATRLRRARSLPERAVLNAGIAGNNLHESSPCYGQSALKRMSRDALHQTRVRYVILDEGVNDITHPTEPPSAPLYGCLAHRKISAAGMISLYKLAVRRIHAAHLRAIGVTLSPFGRYAYWTPGIESERNQINRWIRSTHVFDGIIDFDRTLRDPSHPAWLRPGFDSGDGLHPNDRGHAAMAGAIDLSLFSH